MWQRERGREFLKVTTFYFCPSCTPLGRHWEDMWVVHIFAPFLTSLILQHCVAVSLFYLEIKLMWKGLRIPAMASGNNSLTTRADFLNCGATAMYFLSWVHCSVHSGLCSFSCGLYPLNASSRLLYLKSTPSKLSSETENSPLSNSMGICTVCVLWRGGQHCDNEGIYLSRSNCTSSQKVHKFKVYPGAIRNLIHKQHWKHVCIS